MYLLKKMYINTINYNSCRLRMFEYNSSSRSIVIRANDLKLLELFVSITSGDNTITIGFFKATMLWKYRGIIDVVEKFIEKEFSNNVSSEKSLYSHIFKKK
ncbi:MAG: hypothetical protein ACOC1K_02190 [Nanoarchaeota archaeon]